MEKDQQRIQQMYTELQLIDESLKNVQGQIMAIEEQINNLQGIIDAIEGFKSVKEGSEILVSLSSGIYAKAELKDNKGLVVNVGNGVMVNKTIEQAEDFVRAKLEAVKGYHSATLSEMQRISNYALGLEQEIKKVFGGK